MSQFSQVPTIFGSLSNKSYDTLRLSLYTFVIISSHVGCCFLLQKIFKTPYNRSNSKLGVDGQIYSDYFSNPFAFSLLTYLFCYLLGLITLQSKRSNLQQPHQIQQSDKIPWYEPFKISITTTISAVFLVLVTMLSSFLILTIGTSSELIAVVTLAVFFSKVSDRFRVKRRQIIFAIFICLGVIIFVLFDEHKQQKSVNKPVNWLSGILLLVLLFLYALKSELFAQVRDKYSVSAQFVSQQVCKYTLIFLFVISVVSLQFWKMCVFIWEHDNFILDFSLSCFLNAVGTVASFRASLQYKQHIVPTIGTVRKLISAFVSSIYFHHNLNGVQYGGMGLVFGVIFIDIYLNAKQSEQKQVQNGLTQEIEGKNDNQNGLREQTGK